MATRQLMYRGIFRDLERSILTGEFVVGYQVLTEVELSKCFSASRVTVTQAIRDLVQGELIVRRRGSGSSVCKKPGGAKTQFGMVTETTGAYAGVAGVMVEEIARCVRKLGSGVLTDRLNHGDFRSVNRSVGEFRRHILLRKIKGLFFTPPVAPLMRAFMTLAIRVLDDIALFGADDDEWGKLLAVPATTFRQPGTQTGAVATRMMFERLADPTLPLRTVCGMGERGARESCGATRGHGDRKTVKEQ